MAVNITNRTNSPIGLWATPTSYKVAPAMNGANVSVEPTLASKAMIDLLVKARVITSTPVGGGN